MVRIAIFGVNTDVGKSVFSAGLALAGMRSGRTTAYLKPVQTGPETDTAWLARNAPGISTSEALYSWRRPVSPHVAARDHGSPPPSADSVASQMRRWLATREDQCCVVETAGGPLSPAPDGALQADVYAALKWSAVVLVGDARLGGISTTLAARESLENRGFEISALVVVGGDAALGNADYLGAEALPELPAQPRPLDDWFSRTAPDFDRILRALLAGTTRTVEDVYTPPPSST